MAQFDFMAGIDAVHTLPAGQGLWSLGIDGFAVYLLADRANLYRLAVEPLFDPDRKPGRALVWNAIPRDAVVAIITAISDFSDRHFGDNGDDQIAALGSDLVADIERHLAGN
jgi:hypothetical protein